MISFQNTNVNPNYFHMNQDKLKKCHLIINCFKFVLQVAHQI